MSSLLTCCTCLIIIASIQGENNFAKKRNIYEPESNDPISYKYLPSKTIPTHQNHPSYQIYELNKGFQIEDTSSLDSSSISHHIGHQPLVYGNSLVSTLLLSALLGVNPAIYQGNNIPEQIPVNPYITLLLSQYGRYLPIHSRGTKGLYYYAASNNYHNNKPFGSYKIYEEAK